MKKIVKETKMDASSFSTFADCICYNCNNCWSTSTQALDFAYNHEAHVESINSYRKLNN